MKIRPYTQADYEAVLKVFESNTPKYFAEEEKQEFIAYLGNELEHYFVLESEGEILGNGGFNHLAEENVVRISWDMIRAGAQGQGIGKQLLSFRIDLIKELYSTAEIIVRTSQHAYLFYQKGGFQLENIVEDYWAKDFDLYLMRYKG